MLQTGTVKVAASDQQEISFCFICSKGICNYTCITYVDTCIIIPTTFFVLSITGHCNCNTCGSHELNVYHKRFD